MWSAVVFILYLIGYGVMRAVAWLASLVHVSVPQAIKEQDVPELKVQRLKLSEKEASGGSALLRELFVIAFVAFGAGALALALAGALRRVRITEREDQVVEERESLVSGADLLRGMGTRLARLVPRRARRPRPATPAEAVRREFGLLEAALTRIGRPRPPAATARQYLAAQGAYVQDAAATLIRGLRACALLPARSGVGGRRDRQGGALALPRGRAAGAGVGEVGRRVQGGQAPS